MFAHVSVLLLVAVPGGMTSDSGGTPDARVGSPASQIWRPNRFASVCAFILALFVPSPEPYWSASSVLLWGLFGDPRGPADAIACVVGGAAAIAAYTYVIAVGITALLVVTSRVRQAR